MGMQASAKCRVAESGPRRDGRFGCSFVLHIKNPLFVRCILYIKDSWVSSESFATEVTENLARPVAATKSEALNPKS